MPVAQRAPAPAAAPVPRARLRDEPAAAPGTGRFWPGLLPFLAVLAVVTRLPSFARPLWNPDEGFLATEARMLTQGAVLYRTVVDRKPPVLPWLYELCFTLFGDGSLLPLKALAVLAQLLTAVLLASLARRRWGERAGRTAGALYLLVSIGLAPEDAQAAAFEVFMVPWTVAAMWCADRGRWGAAGLAVAAAMLTKQTGGAVLAPVLLLLWTARGRAAGAAALTLGAVLPVAAVACVTGPARLLFWSVTGSGTYASVAGSVLLAIDRAAANASVVCLACAGLLVPAGALVLARRRAAPPELWLWLAASAVAVATGFHFFGHYYLQLLPPLALLGTCALCSLPRRMLLTAGGLSVLSCGWFLCWGFTGEPPDLPHSVKVARAVRERTAPTARVLFWGMHPEQYWLAGRPPAGRFLTAGLLTNYSGGRGPSRVGEAYGVPGSWPVFRRELRRRPPELIVDDSRGKPYAPSRLPSLRAVLERSYERVGAADGAVLYVRIPDPPALTAGPRAAPRPPPPAPVPARAAPGRR
ncbi:glycosyltransferase family 39 protein [Streptomyces sp. ISL-11]|uniref:ArnT family glycosyltransferase n=1 Tax=Streptomyces sp. ISL-11 TaxID=2819174 RepID=UPI001BE8CB5A|nr:glycosyltransferase family 39 protein [Streptomyces sp. ISL-11]MBT2382308.1 glycosyltransferase family 39 protein [Streptomyces sp. ISL-11]